MMSRFQRLVRQLKHAFGPYNPPKRPTFLTDDELEVRRAVARDLMGDIEPKADRVRQPIDYDKGLPNG
jgi:hypothetical protein